MVKERSQHEADRMQQCDELTNQLQRKNEQTNAWRQRLIAFRKAAMLGRTGNQTLAEQRKKVNNQS